MQRTLLSRRWLGFLVLCLVLASLCVRLGFWQLSRFEHRSATNARITHNVEAPPVPVDRLVRVGGTVDSGSEWRRVTAEGTYDVSHEMLVRQRPLDGANGYEVLTPLVTPDGTALVVNRGWIPAGASATVSPAVPPPPTGEVVVTARLRPSESGPLRQDGLPAGQVRRIALEQIAAELPYPVFGGYAELVDQTPQPDHPLTTLPVDERSTMLNLAYAVQWWLFAVIIVVGWYLLGRREAMEATQSAAPDARARGRSEDDRHEQGSPRPAGR